MQPSGSCDGPRRAGDRLSVLFGFIAAKVLVCPNDAITPAHKCQDGNNFHPTNRYVLFGHHFAAITGAGRSSGPYSPAHSGFCARVLWILLGVVFGGAVHDFVILVASVRRKGRSLADIAHEEPVRAGHVTGLQSCSSSSSRSRGSARVVGPSPIGVGRFTIGLSIPIAPRWGIYFIGARRFGARYP